MKILFISQHYYPEHYSSTILANELAKKGHHVTVLTCSINNKESNNSDVNVIRLNCYLRENNKRFSIIKSYLSFWHKSKKWVFETSEKYDLVISYGTSPVINLSAGNIYARMHRVKHFGYILDLWPESAVTTGYVKKRSLLYTVLKWWSKKIYKNLDYIVVGSPSYIDFFNRFINVDSTKISYIPQPGFNSNNMTNPYVFNNNKTNIIYFGNFTKWQKMDLLSELGFFFESHNIAFHIFSNGSYKDKFEKEISEQGYKNFFLHDFVNQDELDNYILGADFIYVALTNEGDVGKTIPHKLIQSLTYNKPIIAFIGGDGRELIEKYKCAITPNSYDLHGLRTMFEDALKLTEIEKKKIGLNCQLCYKNNFDVPKIINEWTSLLSK